MEGKKLFILLKVEYFQKETNEKDLTNVLDQLLKILTPKKML